MKHLLLIFLLTARCFSQSTEVLSFNSEGWTYLHFVDNDGDGTDPESVDGDYYETWNQIDRTNYNGPAFSDEVPSPFSIDKVEDPLVENGTKLSPPNPESAGAMWFLKEINGGEFGYSNLSLTVKLSGGANVYLNGWLIASSNVEDLRETWETLSTDAGTQLTSKTLGLPQGVSILPGTNLLAVSLHPRNRNDCRQGFDLQLTGTEGSADTVNYRAENIAPTSATIRWESKTPGRSSLRYGTHQAFLDQTVQLADETRFHEVELQELEVLKRHYYEILDGTGQPYYPPVTGSFSTDRTKLISYHSEGWSYFQSADPSGQGSNPTLIDSDYNRTWHDQSLGDYAGRSSYDGPTFSAQARAPFRYAAPETVGLRGGTELTVPTNESAGAIWFLHEIDGGETGFSNLRFYLNSAGGAYLYLNGIQISTHFVPDLEAPDWGTPSRISGEPRVSDFGAFNRYILPGSNLLAIAIHPSDPANDFLGFDLEVRGVPGIPEAVSLATTNLQPEETKLTWGTRDATPSRIRYGSTPGQLDQEINLAGSRNLHEVTLQGLSSFTTYYYEFLNSDGESFSKPAAGQFDTARTSILPLESDGWIFLDALDDNGNLADPAPDDSDFEDTWMNQSLGAYTAPAGYDGPQFPSTGTTPIGRGDVGFDVNTELPPSNHVTKSAVRFLKVIDGGGRGYSSLQLSALMVYGGVIYLNGELVAAIDMPFRNPESWTQRARLSVPEKTTITLHENVCLNPGPNLLAISLQPTGWLSNSSTQGFWVTMAGKPGLPKIEDFEIIDSQEDERTFRWNTGEAGDSILRYGTSPYSMEEIRISEERTEHEVKLSGLVPGSTYYYEILTPDGSQPDPPRRGSVDIPAVTLISETDDGWKYFESLSGGQMVDPQLSDADFNATWFNQSCGNYIGLANYDGPAFMANGLTPFRTAETTLFSEGTILSTPPSGEEKVSWFLKEIDGGAEGFAALELKGLFQHGSAVYLNGVLVGSHNLNVEAPVTWESRANTGNWSISPLLIPLDPGTRVQPGANLLALSVHDAADWHVSVFGFKLSLAGSNHVQDISEPTVMFESFDRVRIGWETSSPRNSTFTYGISQWSPDSTVQVAQSENSHSTILEGLLPGRTYHYEIKTTDQNGLSWNYTSSFQTPSIRRQPYLQSASHDRMTVRWRTSIELPSVLHYGTNLENLDQEVVLPESTTEHAITLTNLAPETRYYYSVDKTLASGTDDLIEGDMECYFITSPLPGTPKKTRIWVIGDSGTADRNAKNVYNGYLDYPGSDETDLWLMLGDNAYNTGTDGQYQAAVFNMYPALLKNTPLWSTIGNHDAYNASTYYNIFDLPRNGEAGGIPSGTEAYYSFDYGNIHFICLDSEQEQEGMLEWMQMDLEATQADWIIAFFHHGPYTKGSHDSDTEYKHGIMREQFLPVLERYGVDLVLAGHSHNYERSRFIDGHYGTSPTFSRDEHVVQSGNGSELGRAGGNGRFLYSGATGAYRKPLNQEHAGQISIIAGASGSVRSWGGLHPAHLVRHDALGSLVIDVEGDVLNARYLSDRSLILDDFTIRKGNELSLEKGVETVKIIRSGSLTWPLDVEYEVTEKIGPDQTPGETKSGTITIPAGENCVSLEIFRPTNTDEQLNIQIDLQPRQEAIQPQAALRDSYRLGTESTTEWSAPASLFQTWWLVVA